MAQDSQKMMKPREFAKEFRIGANTVYELIRTNTLPHLKIGRNVLIPRAAAEKWIEAQIIQGS